MLYLKKTPYNSYCVSADSNRELARSFMRYQEYYESPNEEFRGNIFTIGKYRSWYEKKYGYFSYETDWTGFNIHSYVLDPFKAGLFDPLIPEEQNLLALFINAPDTRYYIIGANDKHTLNHELNHALYAYNKSYSSEIRKAFDTYIDKIQDVLQYLLDKGYCESLLYDELQAYILDDDKTIISKINYSPVVYAVHRAYSQFSRRHYEK